jgi:exodeoxyribonuclease V alpha subunit
MNYKDFEARLKSMSFLDISAVEYPLTFAEALEEKFGIEDGQLDRAVPFLALAVLLQYSCVAKNICLNLDMNSLQSLIKKIREKNIIASSNKKIFPPEEEPECRETALREFDSFWSDILGSECSNTAGIIQQLSDNNVKENNLLNSLVRIEDGRECKEAVPYVIYCDKTRNIMSLYYSRQFGEETFISEFIRNRKQKSERLKSDKDRIKKIIKYLNILFDKNSMDYSIHQKTAAFLSCLSSFFIITGGPGTGKTTTVVKLLLLLQCLKGQNGLSIGMCAPTGKAAARMKESVNLSVKAFREEFEKLGTESMLHRLREEFRNDNQNIDAEYDLLSTIPFEARTIHRLIGSSPSIFRKIKRNNHLPYNILIVDEASMMDFNLFYSLLQAAGEDCSIILLGDQNQLPSVESGSVFSDLCRSFLEKNCTDNEELKKLLEESGIIYSDDWAEDNAALNAVRLTENHRFKNVSGYNSIKNMAWWVNCGGNTSDSRIPAENIEIGSDGKNIHELFSVSGVYAINLASQFSRYYKPAEKEVRIPNKEVQTWLKNLLHKFNGYEEFWEKVKKLCDEHKDLSEDKDSAEELFKSFNTFRVLCTYRETVFGVNSVNTIYQDIHRSSRYAVHHETVTGADGFKWYPGLPVMITKNNHALALFNGDIGITMPDPYSQGIRPELKVIFPMPDGSFRYYPTSVLSDYECAYAITVHKSQGSEMDHVLLLTHCTDSSFITREILYTGITRARKTVTLVYEPELFRRQCERQVSRCSNLNFRI